MNNYVLNLLTSLYGTPGAATPGNPPPPPVLARIGRGIMDDWEPIKQSYLNATNPPAAQAYQAQRNADEAAYDRGFAQTQPFAPVSGLLGAQSWTPTPDDYRRADLVRQMARTLPLGAFVPALGPAEGLMSAGITANAWDALDALRQRFNVAPWLQIPQFWR